MFLKIFALLTFPGVVFHEFGHELFCNLVGVKVRKVCYFRFGNPAGFVEHDGSRYFFQAFLIALGPFLSGTFFAGLFFFLGQRELALGKEALFLWLGFAIALNCLPSKGDAKTLWQENWKHLKRNIFAVLGLPFTFAVWLLSNFVSLWFGILYAGLLFFAVRMFF